MTLVGYRYRFCKDSKTDWIYEREIKDIPLKIMLDFKDADDTFIETLGHIFTKCKDSKLAASICNQRYVGPGEIDSKSGHCILKLLKDELKSPSHLPELGNFEIEEVEIKITNRLAKRIVFDFCFAYRRRNDNQTSIIDLTCLDNPVKLDYLEKSDKTALDNIKVISEPKIIKARDLVS